MILAELQQRLLLLAASSAAVALAAAVAVAVAVAVRLISSPGSAARLEAGQRPLCPMCRTRLASTQLRSGTCRVSLGNGNLPRHWSDTRLPWGKKKNSNWAEWCGLWLNFMLMPLLCQFAVVFHFMILLELTQKKKKNKKKMKRKQKTKDLSDKRAV